MCLQRYHEAMRLQQEGQVGEARSIYREILESEVMEEVSAHQSERERERGWRGRAG